jgi:hypothetical protein
MILFGARTGLIARRTVPAFHLRALIILLGAPECRQTVHGRGQADDAVRGLLSVLFVDPKGALLGIVFMRAGHP